MATKRTSAAIFGGSDLSGGQCSGGSRPALFRTRNWLSRRATAALDPRAEAALFVAVRSCSQTGPLLISHRFATVRRADHIYVLDEVASSSTVTTST